MPVVTSFRIKNVLNGEEKGLLVSLILFYCSISRDPLRPSYVAAFKPIPMDTVLPVLGMIRKNVRGAFVACDVQDAGGGRMTLE